MKRSNNNQSIQANKKGKTMIRSNYQNKIRTNIMCGILTVKLNHNVTRNLPIELICEIVSYTCKFQLQLKFQPVLRVIEDGTMCVLQTLTVFDIQYYVNPIDDNSQRLDQWLSKMHPYNDHEQYEGVSRYVTRFDVIHCSKQLQKNINDVNIKLEKKLQRLQNVIALF